MVSRPADFVRRLTLLLLLAFALLLPGVAGTAQSASPTTQQPAAQSGTPSREERRISSEEARELLDSVDEVLKFDSQNTGLPIRHDVKRSLAGRQQVENYIQRRLRDDEDAERLRNANSVLKKFGLFPRDFDLESFLVQLMGEQVAGYYDTDTKTVYLLDWLPPETQQPVMAHELVHALQDQNFGIEKWVRKADAHKQSGEKQVASDEATAARHAIIEGQAMAVMVDFLLQPIHGSLVNSPLMAQALEQGMLQGSDSPILARSPLYLRQLLLFPYSYGLNFVRELLVHRGKEGAFRDIFKHPPKSTREIMQPETYLAGEKLPALHLPNFESLIGPGYQFFDMGSFGQFDTSVLVQQFGAEPKTNLSGSGSDQNQNHAGTAVPVNAASQPQQTGNEAEVADPKQPPLWSHWRGGYYYAARRKAGATAAPAVELPTSDVALVFVSRWDTPQAASEFARIYRASVPKRYRAVSTPADPPSACAGCDSSALASSPATADHSWQTDEGPVSIEVHDDLVVAIESFPAETAAKMRSAILKAAD